jgi:hypothetical protein
MQRKRKRKRKRKTLKLQVTRMSLSSAKEIFFFWIRGNPTSGKCTLWVQVSEYTTKNSLNTNGFTDGIFLSVI